MPSRAPSTKPMLPEVRAPVSFLDGQSSSLQGAMAIALAPRSILYRNVYLASAVDPASNQTQPTHPTDQTMRAPSPAWEGTPNR
jgi:hypothetical protein